MALKRKRSDSEISTSSGSLLSSPPLHNIVEFSFSSPVGVNMGMELTPLHLSSRTRKRYRDNRPSEATIHQHTLSILYSAQRNPQPSPEAAQTHTIQPATVTNYSSMSSKQTSLHSFWALPTRPSSCGSSDTSTSSPPPNTSYEVEDIQATLLSTDGDAMNVDMDVDIFTDSTDCLKCGKQVCYDGTQRKCSNCATQRRWVGGIGWMDQD